MTFLIINETEFEAKCNFRFDKYADKKYGEMDENGQKTNGFHTIYLNLLQYSNRHLVSFWDCALENYGKKKPSIEQIETALEVRFEEDGDTTPAFKEAFSMVDDSAFFKKQAKSFWKNMELMKTTGADEEEREQNKKAYETMKEAHDELKE